MRTPCRALAAIDSRPAAQTPRFPIALTRLRLIPLMLVLLAGGCATSTGEDQPSTPVVGEQASAAVNQVVTSPNDDREYRYLTLENGLRALLVADPETDKSAAALAVLRGSFDEPANRPGLAHFLEHMLFIGTEKYPELDGYQSFLATHGGSSNAYTSGDHTNYFFDVQPEALDEALDRFSQFFIAPLLDPKYVEREKNAVHSEYQLQLKDDGWRGFAVQKKSMNPEHPGSRFNIGSLETLAGDVQDDLLTYFAEHYSADQMTLVVLGKNSLDDLQSMVTEKFSAIENNQIGPRAALPPVLRQDLLPIEVRHKTQKDTQSLSYNFPVPSLQPHSATKPGVYISNLLGHEGEGSLYNYLRGLGLVESLGASAQRFDDDNSFISIDIELTDAGTRQIQTITEALFDYVELIKAQGIERWRYDEQAALAELAFRFREKGSATGLVYSLAPLMAQFPAAELLTGPVLMKQFDAELIRSYLDKLNPDNVAITRASTDQPTDRVEEYFGVPFALETTAVRFDEDPNPKLALPAANPYVPNRLEVVEQELANPKLALDEPGLQIWLAPDGEFGTPRSSTFLRFATPGGMNSATDIAFAQLYSRLVQDALNAGMYSAQLAGLGYGLGTSGSGFTLNVAGYSDKQQLLLDRVVEEFAHHEIDPVRFGLLKKELLTNWRNFSSERPYTQAWTALRVAVNSQRFSPEKLAAGLEPVSAEQLTKWRDGKLKRIGVTGLLHGNVSKQRVRALEQNLRKTLTLADVEPSDPAIKVIASPTTELVSVDHNDSATVIYVQGDNESAMELARFGLLSQLVRSPYFTALRTEAQLGYVVAAANGRIHKTPGLVFIVQSPVASSEQVRNATIEFVDDYVNILANMPAAEFAAAKEGFLNELREKDKNQHDRAQRYWADLLFEITSFDSAEQIAQAVEQLDQPTMQATVRELRSDLDSAYYLVSSPGKFADTEQAGGR